MALLRGSVDIQIDGEWETRTASLHADASTEDTRLTFVNCNSDLTITIPALATVATSPTSDRPNCFQIKVVNGVFKDDGATNGRWSGLVLLDCANAASWLRVLKTRLTDGGSEHSAIEEVKASPSLKTQSAPPPSKSRAGAASIRSAPPPVPTDALRPSPASPVGVFASLGVPERVAALAGGGRPVSHFHANPNLFNDDDDAAEAADATPPSRPVRLLEALDCADCVLQLSAREAAALLEKLPVALTLAVLVELKFRGKGGSGGKQNKKDGGGGGRGGDMGCVVDDVDADAVGGANNGDGASDDDDSDVFGLMSKYAQAAVMAAATAKREFALKKKKKMSGNPYQHADTGGSVFRRSSSGSSPSSSSDNAPPPGGGAAVCAANLELLGDECGALLLASTLRGDTLGGVEGHADGDGGGAASMLMRLPTATAAALLLELRRRGGSRVAGNVFALLPAPSRTAVLLSYAPNHTAMARLLNCLPHCDHHDHHRSSSSSSSSGVSDSNASSGGSGSRSGSNKGGTSTRHRGEVARAETFQRMEETVQVACLAVMSSVDRTLTLASVKDPSDRAFLASKVQATELKGPVSVNNTNSSVSSSKSISSRRIGFPSFFSASRAAVVAVKAGSKGEAVPSGQDDASAAIAAAHQSAFRRGEVEREKREREETRQQEQQPQEEQGRQAQPQEQLDSAQTSVAAVVLTAEEGEVEVDEHRAADERTCVKAPPSSLLPSFSPPSSSLALPRPLSPTLETLIANRRRRNSSQSSSQSRGGASCSSDNLHPKDLHEVNPYPTTTTMRAEEGSPFREGSCSAGRGRVSSCEQAPQGTVARLVWDGGAMPGRVRLCLGGGENEDDVADGDANSSWGTSICASDLNIMPSFDVTPPSSEEEQEEKSLSNTEVKDHSNGNKNGENGIEEKEKSMLVVRWSGEPLGSGSFGTVRQGLFKGKPCAVKFQALPSDDLELTNLACELSLLKSFSRSPSSSTLEGGHTQQQLDGHSQHPNLMTLFGVFAVDPFAVPVASEEEAKRVLASARAKKNKKKNGAAVSPTSTAIQGDGEPDDEPDEAAAEVTVVVRALVPPHWLPPSPLTQPSPVAPGATQSNDDDDDDGGDGGGDGVASSAPPLLSPPPLSLRTGFVAIVTELAVEGSLDTLLRKCRDLAVKAHAKTHAPPTPYALPSTAPQLHPSITTLATALPWCPEAEALFPWPLRLRCASELSSALAMLHQHGIIHRDVKAANVLFDSEWRVRLCDYGLCVGSQSEARLSFVGGTEEFMAPEILLADCEGYGVSADVFSLGLVLASLVALRPVCGQDEEEGFLQRSPRSFFEVEETELRNEAEIPSPPPPMFGSDDEDQDEHAADTAAAELTAADPAAEVTSLPSPQPTAPTAPPILIGTRGCPSSFLELAVQCTQPVPGDRPSAVEAVAWVQSLTQDLLDSPPHVREAMRWVRPSCETPDVFNNTGTAADNGQDEVGVNRGTGEDEDRGSIAKRRVKQTQEKEEEARFFPHLGPSLPFHLPPRRPRNAFEKAVDLVKRAMRRRQRPNDMAAGIPKKVPTTLAPPVEENEEEGVPQGEEKSSATLLLLAAKAGAGPRAAAVVTTSLLLARVQTQNLPSSPSSPSAPPPLTLLKANKSLATAATAAGSNSAESAIAAAAAAAAAAAGIVNGSSSSSGSIRSSTHPQTMVGPHTTAPATTASSKVIFEIGATPAFMMQPPPQLERTRERGVKGSDTRGGESGGGGCSDDADDDGERNDDDTFGVCGDCLPSFQMCGLQ